MEEQSCSSSPQSKQLIYNKNVYLIEKCLLGREKCLLGCENVYWEVIFCENVQIMFAWKSEN